ncbi:MAG: restriction endonuclease subunit S [Bacteroidetes bacterium]|nr:restriction endonuclease subunit S [Bacteroidota bacterium]
MQIGFETIVKPVQMQKRLEDIASITSGVYEKVHPSGDTLYLQGKHFDAYGRIRRDMIMHPELQADERLGKHLLRDGDILLIAKGENNKACLYQKEIGQAVASSTFFLIRLTESGLLPEFLQWYFNTEYMKDMFSALSLGTQIASLSKKTLSEIEVPVPPLTKQKEMLEMQRLWDTEKALTTELLNLKDTLYQKLLLNQAKSTLVK